MTTDRLSEITARIPDHEHPWKLEPRIEGQGDEEWERGWSIWTAKEDGEHLAADVHDEFSPDDEDCDGVSGIVVANIDCKNDVPPDAERIAQFILHAPQDMRWLVAEVTRLAGTRPAAAVDLAPDQAAFSGATLNHLIGEAEACRDRAKHLGGARWTSTVTSANHRAAEGHERLAGELDQLRAIAELMNANAWFADFVRVQLDPRTAARHKAAAEIQEITLGAESTYQQRHGEEPTEDEFDPERDGQVRDYEAWLEREQGAGRLLDTYGESEA